MTKQSQTMIRGTVILTLAGVFAKIISAFYKVPLAHLTGTVGLSYYNAVYPLYSMLTAAALIGIPNSVSKLVAEEIAKKEYHKAHQTFRMAFVMTAILGLIVSLLLFGFSDTIIKLFHWKEGTYYSLVGLSFAPLFIAVAGAIRGYMQGMQIMIHSAISQIIENTFKVIIGIGLVVILLNLDKSIAQSVGGAAFGVSLALLLSTLYLSVVYLKKRPKIKENIDKYDGKVKYSRKELAKKISYIAVPVTVASAAYSIMSTIDSLTLPMFLRTPMIAESIQITQGQYILGVFAKVQTIVNVPMVISISLIISVVPSISAANVHQDKKELVHKINEAMEMAIKLSLPAAVGIFVLAKPILNFVYQNPEGSDYLKLFALSLIFMIVSQSLIGVLQGLSRYYLPLVIVLIASAVKIVTNITLINSPLEGYGSLIGTNLFYLVITFLSYGAIKKIVSFKQTYYHTFVKPLIASAFMGIITYFTYVLVHNLVKSNALATLSAVFIGMTVYVFIMTVLKGFTRDEIMILPKHDRIIKYLDKHHFVKD